MYDDVNSVVANGYDVMSSTFATLWILLERLYLKKKDLYSVALP